MHSHGLMIQFRPCTTPHMSDMLTLVCYVFFTILLHILLSPVTSCTASSYYDLGDAIASPLQYCTLVVHQMILKGIVVARPRCLSIGISEYTHQGNNSLS
jgi:hypothetical protein